MGLRNGLGVRHPLWVERRSSELVEHLMFICGHITSYQDGYRLVILRIRGYFKALSLGNQAINTMT